MCATLKWKVIAVILLVLCAAVASAVLMLRGARADLQEPVLNTAGSSSSFPVIEVYDHTGQKTDVLQRPSSHYKLLFSLTTSCQSCNAGQL
jgi:ABC-type phosphate transport system substrate-binding protein